jgi:glycerol-3-phosphate dehydrogenase
MNREEMLSRVKSRAKPWDIVVIGGGAVGRFTALAGQYTLAHAKSAVGGLV